MMKLIIPIVMLLIGVGAGIGAGLALKPEEPPAEEGEEQAETEDSPAEEEKEEEGEDAPETTEFARLNNQFIVPVIKNDAVSALVVMSITLEVEIGGSQTVYSQEPRLRDSFLRVLFDHANVGGFDAGFTQAGTMAILRNGLKEAAKKALGSLVQDVLIVDIVRQEV